MISFLDTLSTWTLYFFVYSILGWVFESIYCSIKAKPPHFINRGFLFGPLCPIYGAGLVSVAFLMQPFKNMNPGQEFVVIVLVCTVIEYVASYVMEKLYHVRWWSYHNSWYNFTINGRVSFWTSVGFGIGGLLVLNYIHPTVASTIDGLSFGIRFALAFSMVIIFMIDNYMSNAAASSVKHALKGGHVDLTDEIKRYAFNYYRKQTRKTRRFARKILRAMKRAQKRAIKGLKGTQKKIQKHALKIEYLTRRHEVRKEIAKTDIKTIPRKTERMKKNSKVDLK
jgi:uncharacterized membrane protein